MRDLTQHLTTRADDSHAAPVQTGIATSSRFHASTICMSRLGKVLRVELSHILHRLCRPPSISLSFNLATVLPRRRTYRVYFATSGVNSTHSKCAPFTAKTTGVSNPVCYLGFRASASDAVQGLAFATGVPLDIYAFHCYTENSSLLSGSLVR